MADGTVRGCVWGAARVLVPYPTPLPDGLLDAIEDTYQALQRDGTTPLLPRRRGIDHKELARLHDAGYTGQQMAL